MVRQLWRCSWSAYFGGNSNNDANYGLFAWNVNNTASNTNWNIGAAHSYLYIVKINAPFLPCPLAKINSFSKHLLVASRKRMRG